MDSIDEQIARAEATVKACEDNLNKLTTQKILAQNELLNLKKTKNESEKRKERNASFKFAIELLEFAMQRNDGNASKIGWMAIEKIRNAINDIDA
jgi:hypothetical protein